MADFAAGHLDIGVAAGDEDGQARGEAGGQLGWIVAVGLGQEQRRRGTEDSGQDGRQVRWYGAGSRRSVIAVASACLAVLACSGLIWPVRCEAAICASTW